MEGITEFFAFLEEGCFWRTLLCSNFIFPKLSCGSVCKFSNRSDEQFLGKLTFLSKIPIFKTCIFWPKSQNSSKLASYDFHHRIQRLLFCWCPNCQLRNFFQCTKIFVLLTGNDQKLALKIFS